MALTPQWVSLAQLQVGFYSNSCPNAESIVSSVVREFAQSDVTILAALLRLHYHDCIVQGCDGSVLIQQPAGAGNLEKSAQNHAGLRGFEVIDRAKEQLEAQCPGVVSCADILALAARDSVFLSRGPFYELPTGRRDGRVSNVSDADNMPEVHESIDVLKAKFAAKGLSGNDLVLLSAAHTIGTTACFFLESRLYNFGGRGGSDPSINPSFLPELESQCPQGGDVNVRLPLDRGSETVFDAQILRNIRSGFAAIESDAQLYADPSTRAIVDSYLDPLSPLFGPFFRSDFADSMVRMGRIGVRTGVDGEVRRNCSAFN
ncbi:Peroxidase 43 [Ananas comosus]|nr:Peroxidase 43 [Ananas comosus]